MSNSIPCFIFSFQADRPIEYFNDLMINALGFNTNDVFGKLRFEDFLSGGSRILFTTHFYPILLLEKELNEIFMSLRSKNGEDIPVLINMRLENKEDRQYITGVAFKISKRNDYERRILEAKHEAENALKENVELTKTKTELETSRMLLEDQLVSMARINKEQHEFNKILAHDLQEPIRKIQIFASRLENLTDAQQVNDKSRLYVKRVKDLSKFSHELLKRLQVLHSLEYKLLNYATEDIETFVQEAALNIGGVPLKVILQEMEVKQAFGDISQLIILFSELFMNAYQYRRAERPPTITISSSKITDNYHQALTGAFRYVDYLRLKITDNCQGFTSYSADDIYKPFQKSKNATGKGLGLAFCKKIVDLHKGRISARATASGGSEFIILLPMSPELKNK